jgi:hypothetical protein
MSVRKVDRSSRDDAHKVTRRGFVRDLLAAGTGVAAVAATGSGAAVAAAPATGEGEGDSARGYRETQHVRDYYRTASF